MYNITEKFIKGNLYLVVTVVRNGIEYRRKNKGIFVQSVGNL